jgi:hypothetical protein
MKPFNTHIGVSDMSNNDAMNVQEAQDAMSGLIAEQVVPAAQNAEPDDTWATEKLVEYAMTAMGEAGILARKTTVLVFRAGHALSLLRPRFKAAGSWCRFQQENGLPRTSVWEALEFYSRAQEQGRNEENISTMTWTEAKECFGITKPKKDDEPADLAPAGPCVLFGEEFAAGPLDAETTDRDHTHAGQCVSAVPAEPACKAHASDEQRAADRAFLEKPGMIEITDEDGLAFQTFVENVGGLARAQVVFAEMIRRAAHA